jgi:Carboxypeptidase regulatory-like domain
MTSGKVHVETQGEQARRRWPSRLVLLFWVLNICVSLNAQHTASLTGRVFDPQNNAVAQASLKLIRPSTGSVRQVVSDGNGSFGFESVEPGVYQLSAEAPNFDSVTREIAVFAGHDQDQDLQFLKVVSQQSVTVVGSVADAMSPDPSLRTFATEDLLEANPGRPGAPVSIPGLPVETASGGIKAPQYFAPGVAGDHGEPIAQFIQVGNFLVPNNLPANAHGNGYADPNVLIPNGIASVAADSGAFSVREGNNAVDAGVSYGLRSRLQPFTQVTGDAHDVDFVTGWSPSNPRTLGWLALETLFGNGFLERPEHRRQYKLNAFRQVEAGLHQLSFLGDGYYGSSFIPGLIPVDVPVQGDTIDSRQHDKTHNSLLVATDTWQLSGRDQFQFSVFFRTYGLDLSSDFGDGLIRQSEFRTVSGGNASYLFRPTQSFSVLAGLDLRRDAPRNLNLAHADLDGVFRTVTSNDLTLGFFAPFVSIDGSLGNHIRYDLGVRREEVDINNVDKITPLNSLAELAGITLPKGTLTLLPPHSRILPKVSFSIGKAFHTNDPRIGTGSGTPTVIAPSNSMRLVLSKDIQRTDFSVALARVTNAEELAKIDPDTGLQEDVGPSVIRSLTLSARRYFSFGSVSASWARATATDRLTGADIPEAPRLIWSLTGVVNHLPLGLRVGGEYEVVGRKPLGDGFAASPVREFRFSLARSFRKGQMDLGLNSLLATGYTGQTLETLALPQDSAAFERIVGVPLKSFIGVSWTYNFRKER